MAALLLRTGLPIDIVAPADAELALIHGEPGDASPVSCPRIVMPRKSYRHGDAAWRDDFAAAVRRGGPRFQESPGPVAHADIDLAGLLRALLEGWEEAADTAPADPHGRFPAESSLPNQLRVLDRPILDQWARSLGRTMMRLAGDSHEFTPLPFAFCATFDIDSAGMFRGATAIRSLARIARQRPTLLPEATWHALRVQLRMARDPHLTARPLGEMLEGMDVPATFFVQTHRLHRLDNYSLRRAPGLADDLRAILRNGVHQVGLHSSYVTRDLGRRSWRTQWKRLRAVLGPQVSPVHRAHYLRAPDQAGYPIDEAAGEIVDSSIAFGAREGFRRGTAWPWRPAPGVVELAPCVMDTTLRHFTGADTADAAHDRSVALLRQVAATGGAFVPVWHTNNLDPYLWPGWRDALIDVIREARRLGARFQSLATVAVHWQHQADRLEAAILRATSR